MQFAGGVVWVSRAPPLLLQSDPIAGRLELISKEKVCGHMHSLGVRQPIRCFKFIHLAARPSKKNATLCPCSSEERKTIYTRSVSMENHGGLVGEETECLTLDEIKSTLCHTVEGINRGIFGVPSAKKFEIEGLVNLLESLNPTLNPTQNLEKVAGCWKLIYSTITILGSKRTKLGLRDFIALGDFLQIIDIAKGKAANVIKFNVRGLNILNGQLVIEASFKIASNTRVDISYSDSSITPEQLMNLFRQNYDLLLSIFNPEGWLEITYVDDTLRIGRDDKGNIFILERSEDAHR